MSMESFNLTALCNLTQERIKELYHISENSDKAGDATWILTSAFIIFTMQSGFGLLEAGSVSSKNECNIMVKNAVDVIFGGLGYWICGFAFSFGEDETYSNAFTGFGSFFTGSSNDDNSDIILSKYFFQLSFATTATTIVSGAMAERTNLKAYMFFSFINFLSYVFPAHWIWAEGGYFKMKGVVDVAGCGPVHVVGGTAAIVASIILKPRTGVFDHSQDEKRNEYSTMASPTNVVLGTFMLWWGWLGFNCGSTFGVSGGKWKLASRAAVTTVNASVGGGIWSVFYCYVLTKEYNHKLDIGIFTNCILGGLVSITAICALCKPWEALLVGMAGGFIVSYGVLLIGKLKIDDPVSCIPVHCFCGMWGMVCVGLFGEKDEVENINLQYGVAKGGPASFLGYQIAAALAIAAWSGVSTAIQLKLTDLIFGLRMTLEEELMGADASEHGILDSNAPSMLKSGMSRGGSSRTLGKKYSTIIRNKEVATAGSEELRKRGMTNSSKETESDFGYISYHTGEGGSPLYDRAVNVNLKLCSSRSFSLRSPFVRNQLTSNSSRDERRSMSLNHKDAVLELADKIPTTQILHKVNKSPKIFEHKLYRSNSFS